MREFLARFALIALLLVAVSGLLAFWTPARGDRLLEFLRLVGLPPPPEETKEEEEEEEEMPTLSLRGFSSPVPVVGDGLCVWHSPESLLADERPRVHVLANAVGCVLLFC